MTNIINDRNPLKELLASRTPFSAHELYPSHAPSQALHIHVLLDCEPHNFVNPAMVGSPFPCGGVPSNLEA